MKKNYAKFETFPDEVQKNLLLEFLFPAKTQILTKTAETFVNRRRNGHTAQY